MQRLHRFLPASCTHFNLRLLHSLLERMRIIPGGELGGAAYQAAAVYLVLLERGA